MEGNIISVNKHKLFYYDFYVEDSKIEELMKWLEEHGEHVKSEEVESIVSTA